MEETKTQEDLKVVQDRPYRHLTSTHIPLVYRPQLRQTPHRVPFRRRIMRVPESKSGVAFLVCPVIVKN
ncbi:Hypothetical predicted protein [Marmota monax]|uniref:Uncharacterized protein n=1 Tax=Marmota monax TaxID=9995 RepID=A0A5E4AM37_MARMO|nr:Hypothetical predicted protein [Marmota monax]